ncbi:MAG: AraC family transcriptional regulator [Myxococcota bacterium]
MLTPSKLVVLCAARDRICDVTPDAPSVREVAAEASLSTGLFIRQFAALFGETPHQMRIRVRLESAKQLLASGECSVTEACFEVGFSSLGSFSALFRRRVGLTPSEYRERFAGHDLQPGCLTLMGAAAKNDHG